MNTTNTHPEGCGCNHWRCQHARIRAQMVARTKAILAGEIKPEYDDAQKRRMARDAAREAKAKRTMRSTSYGSTCRRCGGPCADGSGHCGEC